MNSDLEITQYVPEYKPWESKYLNCPVYYFDCFRYNELFFINLNKPCYLYTSVLSEDIKIVNCLESSKFKTLTSMITLESDLDYDLGINNFNIYPVKNDEIFKLKIIAKTSFKLGRLYSMMGEISSDMYPEWIENCCNKLLADEVFVSHFEEIPTGFIAVKAKDSVSEIRLIAVAPSFRGKGIGKNLIFSSKMPNTNKIIVKTEFSNISAIRVYEDCGFKTIESSTYMGRWINKTDLL